jgi:hypothetical protein
MPSAFAITTTANSITLDSRRGESQFTVSNATGRPLRARARVTPEGGAAAAWFTIAGEVERDFPVDGTQQYVVQIAVPGDVPPGRHSFRLDVVGVQNPDEEFAQGPSVAFVVAGAPSAPPLLKTRKGYLATLLGALVGILAGVTLGLILGLLAALVLAGLNNNAAGAAFGILFGAMPLVGAALGGWLALRMRGYEWPRETGLVLAGVFLVWEIIGSLILYFISNANLSGPLGPILALGCVIPSFVIFPALAARGIILLLKTRGI